MSTASAAVGWAERLEWTFGDRLRKIRRVLGVSQEEFASAIQHGRQALAAWEYRVARSGHYIVTKDGQRVTTISGTPSDYRSDRNAKADLRRSGFDWPRK